MGEAIGESRVSNLFSVVIYFLHGILFSLLLAGLWPLMFPVDWILQYPARPLTYEPLFVLIVVVYGFLGLFIVLGELNSAIARQLWSTKTSQTWQEALIHGAVLFLLLSIVQLLVILLMGLLASMQPGMHFATNEQATFVLLGLSVLITPIPNGVLCRRLWLALSAVQRPASS